MAAMVLGGPDPAGPRAKRSPVTLGRVAAVGALGLVLFMLWSFFSAQIVSKRPHEMKTTQVILPPPPPPPPPPEVKPQEKPPEPVDTPMEEPVDTPPPPDQAKSADPVVGDSALTAREGAGPSNYGLARGDGSGTRIGGRPGGAGDAFRAYANVALGCLRTAAQRDRELSRGRFTAQLAVAVDAAGRIASVRSIGGDDARRNARLTAVLTGLQCTAPPANMPVMRVELSSRSGA